MPYLFLLEEHLAHINIQSSESLTLLTSMRSVVCLSPQTHSRKFRIAALGVDPFYPLLRMAAQQKGMVINMIQIQINDVIRSMQLANLIFEDGLYFQGLLGKIRMFSGRLKKYEEHIVFCSEDIVFIDSIIELSIVKKIAESAAKAMIFSISQPIDISQLQLQIPVFICDLNAVIQKRSCADIKIDLSNYCVRNYPHITLIADNKLDAKVLFERVWKDFREICQFYLNNIHINHFTVLYTIDMKKLTELTGKTSTFAFRDRFVALIYKRGRFRPELHELTHVALYKIGRPPFLLLEGLATISADIIEHHNCRASVDVFTYKMLDQVNSLTPLLSGSYTYENMNVRMYYVAASFVHYVITVFGIKKVIELYMLLDRRLSVKHNLEIFKYVLGSSFYEVEQNWKMWIRKGATSYACSSNNQACRSNTKEKQ